MKKLVIIILFLAGFVKVQANCATGVVPVPVVDYVTVDIAGNVTICWQPVVDPDLAYYTIFMVNPLTGANDSIDISPIGSTCYTLLAASNNSDNVSIELGVVAVDNCDNKSAVGVNYHKTIWLDYLFDVCSASATLTWNAYTEFTSGTNVLYSIYVSVNGGAYTLAGTSSLTTYSYSGITQGSTYDFYVEASENVGAGPFTSSSNDINVPTVTFLKIPTFTYLYTATVTDSLEIALQFYVDTVADVSFYDVQRSTSIGGPFASVGTITKFAGMSPAVSFTDNADVNANENYYFYQVVPVNICGTYGAPSNIGRTINLKVESDPVNAVNTLRFTQYDGWLGNVEKYEVYRAVAGVWETSPLTTFSAFTDTMVYVDDITNAFQGDGEYCYKIIAKENFVTHVYGTPAAESYSNEVCAYHQPYLYVPNAFVPSGTFNTEFKPVLTFADPENYLFQIYNKWGLVVFETTDVNEAWNGRINNTGDMSQSDVYVYLVEFLSAQGNEFSQRGKITLLN